jgi:hypothetical protein
MSEDPRKKASTLPPPVAPSADDDRSERPTLAPPFDVEAFARSSTGPASRRFSTDSPTEAPPPGEQRSERITMTNEVELEKARAESVRLGEPVRYRTPSALSIVNARMPSSPILPAARSPTPSSIEAAVLGVVNSSPAPEITERTIEDPIAEMRERFSLGDYTGALEMAELILAEDPATVEAEECAENCRSVLEKMYAARLGPLSRRPSVLVARAQLRWLSLDHRAGFVLSLIDGTSTLDMILDLSGMPRLDALRILLELVQQKVVALS